MYKLLVIVLLSFVLIFILLLPVIYDGREVVRFSNDLNLYSNYAQFVSSTTSVIAILFIYLTFKQQQKDASRSINLLQEQLQQQKKEAAANIMIANEQRFEGLFYNNLLERKEKILGEFVFRYNNDQTITGYAAFDSMMKEYLFQMLKGVVASKKSVADAEKYKSRILKMMEVKNSKYDNYIGFIKIICSYVVTSDISRIDYALVFKRFLSTYEKLAIYLYIVVLKDTELKWYAEKLKIVEEKAIPHYDLFKKEYEQLTAIPSKNLDKSRQTTPNL